MYNQYTDKYLHNSCSLVTLLHIMLYSYAVRVEPSFIMKIAIFFDKLWLRSPDSWAVFNIIYNGFVYYMNKKLWLNFKVTVNQISKLKITDPKSYWLGIKWYSTYKWNKISKKGYLTKEDMDYLASFTGWIGHNTMWDWSGWGYHKDTNWVKAYKFPLEVLQYWQQKNLFWDNIRTVEPADEETKEVCKLCIEFFKAEKKWNINLAYNKFSESPYLEKAKKLYNYGK